MICIAMIWILSLIPFFPETPLDNVEFIDSTNKFNKIYYDTTINALKKKNAELYDSLKDCRDQITYLVQFKYEKTYSTGKVKPKKETTI